MESFFECSTRTISFVSSLAYFKVSAAGPMFYIVLSRVVMYCVGWHIGSVCIDSCLEITRERLIHLFFHGCVRLEPTLRESSSVFPWSVQVDVALPWKGT